MSWIPKGGHGLSGHIYEIIEYFLILKDHIKTRILICEDVSWEQIRAACITKYTLTDDEINNIRNSIVFANKPSLVRGTNLLVVDGNLSRSFIRYGVKLCFKNIFCFRCTPKDTFTDLPYTNVTLLQDNRLYKDTPTCKVIDYRKKILFSKFRQIDNNTTNTGMFYLTSNCRRIDPMYLREIIVNHHINKFIVLTNDKKYYQDYVSDLDVSFPSMPVADIFETFDTYIYTIIDEQLNPGCGCFDCSPRFVAECVFYNKNITYYDIDDDYLNIDLGLKYRKRDVENGIDSVELLHSDNILNIIKDITHE